MASVECLVSFERDLLLVLATDASPVGMSGFYHIKTSHIYITRNISERPITFISRSLITSVQKIYAE